MLMVKTLGWLLLWCDYSDTLRWIDIVHCVVGREVRSSREGRINYLECPLSILQILGVARQRLREKSAFDCEGLGYSI